MPKPNQDITHKINKDKKNLRIKKEVSGLSKNLPELWVQYLNALKPEEKELFENIPSYLFKLFRLDRYISSGGQGATFLVRDGMGRKAVMKIGSFEILRDEYIALTSIVSPNIISLYMGEKFGDSMVLIEEYVNGVNLGQIVKHAKANHWVGSESYNVFVTMILLQIFNALNSIHNSKGECDSEGKLEDRSFIHRDIKPENIMLSYDGNTKLIDFGLARKNNMQSKNLKRGFSLPYSSPNQLKTNEHNILDDYFSLACLAHALYDGGIKPFYNQDDIKDILNGRPDKFIEKQSGYFKPKFQNIEPIIKKTELIIKNKFVPSFYRERLAILKQNPHLSESQIKSKKQEFEKLIKQASEFDLAGEMLIALKEPFEDKLPDISHFTKIVEAHQFVHYNFLGRQSILLKPKSS